MAPGPVPGDHDTGQQGKPTGKRSGRTGTTGASRDGGTRRFLQGPSRALEPPFPLRPFERQEVRFPVICGKQLRPDAAVPPAHPGIVPDVLPLAVPQAGVGREEKLAHQGRGRRRGPVTRGSCVPPPGSPPGHGPSPLRDATLRGIAPRGVESGSGTGRTQVPGWARVGAGRRAEPSRGSPTRRCPLIARTRPGGDLPGGGVAGERGGSAYDLIAQMCYDAASMTAALQSTAGRAAGKDPMGFAGERVPLHAPRWSRHTASPHGPASVPPHGGAEPRGPANGAGNQGWNRAGMPAVDLAAGSTVHLQPGPGRGAAGGEGACVDPRLEVVPGRAHRGGMSRDGHTDSARARTGQPLFRCRLEPDLRPGWGPASGDGRLPGFQSGEGPLRQPLHRSRRRRRRPPDSQPRR